MYTCMPLPQNNRFNNLIFCKTLLNISVKYPTFLPYAKLSVLLNKCRAKPLVQHTGDRDRSHLETDYRQNLLPKTAERWKYRKKGENSNLNLLLFKFTQGEVLSFFFFFSFLPFFLPSFPLSSFLS